MGRIEREETNFQSAPDTRFGGNISRANVGAQYPRGGVDLRYENYQRPQQVDYTRNVPRQTGTPNFGGPMRPQGGTYSHELGHPARGYDFNPRPNLKGRFQEPGFHRFPQSGPAGAPVEGPWNMQYETPMRGGLGGLQETAGLWQDWKRIFNKTGNAELADQWVESQQVAGGYGYDPPKKSYSDIYKGTDVIDMEVLPGAGYGPDDEYDFDYKRNRFEDLLEGKWPQYAARGGLMSLRR